MMNPIRILFVEDDPALRMVICETLEFEGFSVLTAHDGISGMEMVSRMRQRNHTIPILFLTAKSSADSVVEGFQAGADDYIRKPFSMKELIVRIRALYARGYNSMSAKETSHIIKIGSFSFDPVSQYLSFKDNTYTLSSRESEILNLLVEHINEVVPTTHIMKSLWGDDSCSVINSLLVFITRLRQRLKEDSSVRIVNARGVGYKLTVDIPAYPQP